MVDDKQLGWLKDFLRARCKDPEDRESVDDIVNTLRKLWVVARASEQNPYQRSPRLEEALATVRKPNPPRLGSGSL